MELKCFAPPPTGRVKGLKIAILVHGSVKGGGVSTVVMTRLSKADFARFLAVAEIGHIIFT